MAPQIVSIGVSWFRTFTFAYADDNGNLVLEVDCLPKNKSFINLQDVFPEHVIQELLNCNIRYSNADDTHRRVGAFKEWFRASSNPNCVPCLSVKLTRDKDDIILYSKNERAKVPVWCERIRLFRVCDSLELLDLPLIRVVNAALHK